MTAFDLLEARLNRTALAKLANAVATFGDQEVPVIFDAEYRRGMVGPVGMGAASPQMVLSSAAVPIDFIDTPVRVAGVDWTVSDRQPDGPQETGLTTVFLERA